MWIVVKNKFIYIAIFSLLYSYGQNILLKKFGSVQKIKEASIDEISDTKGIDKELAKKIKNNL